MISVMRAQNEALRETQERQAASTSQIMSSMSFLADTMRQQVFPNTSRLSADSDPYAFNDHTDG